MLKEIKKKTLCMYDNYNAAMYWLMRNKLVIHKNNFCT